VSHADFVHLRVHSAYSLAEGAIKIPDLIARCRQERMPAVALTDTGNLFGALEFSKAAASEGIQPIIGCQLRTSLRASDPRHQELRLPGIPPHCDQLVLLAQNTRGYQNLMKLVSQSYLQYPHNPHISFEWLTEYHEGLIALSGGLDGGGAKLLLQGQKQSASDLFQNLGNIFQNRFYIEVTRHGWDDQRESDIEGLLIQLAYDLHLPLVATNEAFFIDESMYEAHDALLCVATGSYVSKQDRRRVTRRHRLRSPREMREIFQDLPEAIENTLVIAERCGFMVEPCKPMLPPFPSDRKEPDELAFQAHKGLEQRLKSQVFREAMMTEEREQYQRRYSERLGQEIETISRMGYAGYYLIVSDFVKWARNHHIPVGPGRGSGAGSLVAWVLTITDIDPIYFGLPFERFLNPERISMPDFDIDFCQERRDEVIAYVRDKYGHDRVAQISTFGKLQARAVLRDVGRVLGMPYGQVDRLSKMIPNNPASPVTLNEAFKQDPQFQQLAREDTTVQQLLDIAMKLEGLYRHVSTHAAGIVIGDRCLDELVPLYHDGKSQLPATQFNMKDVETVGLVKLDFLGLKTLTIIQKTLDLLKPGNIEIDISTIPLDDTKTFEMLQRVETVGIFQVEGAGMRDVLRRMQPYRFEELIALVALYRPGPMDDIPRYLACKHGQEPVNYGHPLLENTLKETYGVMVYQEQVMQIAQVMGGYTLGAADLLRRAMGKKIKSEMDAQRQIFVEGAEKKGVKKALASQLFDQMAKFAGYGFNKCHAGPYALIIYQTAYLKANYPVEFMAATMTYDMNNTDKLNLYREELVRLNIPLLPPDINHSFPDFRVEKTADGRACIRYALAAVKNVGETGMKDLVREREEGGAFRDLIDFARRLDSKIVNKRMLENLICAGAFDQLHPHRAQLFESVDIILKYVGEKSVQNATQQNNLFGSGDIDELPVIKFPSVAAWSGLKSLQNELEAMGFYLSAHPLDTYGAALDRLHLTSSSVLQEMCVRQESVSVTMAGVMINKKERFSKNGSRFAFITFSDSSGIFEVTIFSEVYTQYRERLEAGATMLMKVSARLDGDSLRLTVNGMEELNSALGRHPACLEIHLTGHEAFEHLKAILESIEKGNSSIKIVMKPKGRRVTLKLPRRFNVTPAIRESLGLIPGIESLKDV
jgi:DNA polymerase-3 subunit alpha